MKPVSILARRASRSLRLPERIAIRHLALGFIAIMLALVAAMGGYALHLSGSVSARLAEQDRQAAHDEVLAHVRRLLEQTEQQADALGRWDETAQQLTVPEYYGYWRDYRVYEAGMLPPSVASVALYAHDGRQLGPLPKGSPMPASLPISARSNGLVKESGNVLLYHRFAVPRDERGQVVLGYGLLRVRLIPALMQRGSFYQADKDTLQVAIRPGEVIDTLELPSRLVVEPRADPNRSMFQRILSQTMVWLFLVLLVLSVVGYLVYRRLLVQPLQQLAQDIDGLQEGRSSNLSRPLRIAEMDDIRRSLHTYQLQLRELHGTLETQNREFRTQALQDVLTGCYNRRAYDEDWRRLSHAVESKPQDVAYLLFDCDRFKSINDTYGHPKGDRVLVMIADALVMALRANDHLYRLGGDEFAAVLMRTTATQARQIAKRCQSLIEAASFAELGIQEPVSISIGIAFCSTDSPPT